MADGIFTLTAYKLRDNVSTADWYLVETKIEHGPVSYTASLNWRGPYVICQDVEVDLDPGDHVSSLVEYGPDTTQAGGSVTYSVGSSLRGGPESSVSRTYNIADAMMRNLSEPQSKRCVWSEAITALEYKGWLTCNWTRDLPVDISYMSHFVNHVSIWRTTGAGLTQGIKVYATAVIRVRYETDDPYFLGCRYDYSDTYSFISRTNQLYANSPPDRPAVPSMSSPLTVGVTYECETAATDPDGDALTFQFDWGDGLVGGYGPSR